MATFQQADFDPSAQDYDDLFTYSEIGKYQREVVWNYLDKNILSNKKINILELNCGTGEDAAYFAQKGNSVIATDISSEMVAKAQSKAKHKNLTELINCEVCAVQDIDKFNAEQFDLIFSNFGGLNCLTEDELKTSSKKMFSLLRKNGRFVSVVMPDYCWMDSLYFLLKFQFGKIFRRAAKNGLQVNVNGLLVDTFYYSPNTFYEFYDEDFNFKKNIPVGLFVPPSFLENTYQKVSGLLSSLDKVFNRFDGFSRYADHYLIDLEKK